jgi:hypothetical protein
MREGWYQQKRVSWRGLWDTPFQILEKIKYYDTIINLYKIHKQLKKTVFCVGLELNF